MKKNFFIIISIVNVLNATCFSQQTIDNDKAHRRYWYYRTRMINDFM